MQTAADTPVSPTIHPNTARDIAAGTTSSVRRRGLARHRLEVTGAVQGVGFRPFAYRLAHELGLAGFVGNGGAGAFVEIEGPEDALRAFTERLRAEAPRLARIENVSVLTVPVRHERTFVIAASATGTAATTLVPPDTATCDACLAEVGDPTDRRYRHPFANCTDCGPRFTIIQGLPYDRPETTMAAFPLCEACTAEYHDPGDRRHHAQPISCPHCGPKLRFTAHGDAVTGTDAALAAVHAVWAAGGIVAVKGVGGYHLTCDAASDEAVTLLRERKGRGDKPFALMVIDLAAAEMLVELTTAERKALLDPSRPIVLAHHRTDAEVAGSVAPGLAELGVMLAYTALHRLLLSPVPGCELEPPAAIVASSGNLADEPICTADDEAELRLAAIADAFLSHDREIAAPCDDSVVRLVNGVEQPLRRSRGWAPLPVTLAVELPPTLAVGGELKNTFCLAAGRHAWLSQHIGDLENLETLAAFERSVAQFKAMYRVEPTVIATDAHPGYLSRRWAYDHRGAAELVEVQHHHAHVASLMAEHGLPADAEVIGIAFDGTGFGPALDGGAAAGGFAAWGGEVLVARYDRFRRAGHLAELPLVGGDAGVRNPCRLALAYLLRCAIDPTGSAPLDELDDTERAVVARQVETGAGIVPTTSMGRLFDVVASLLGLRHRVTYEGQAAMLLEAAAARAPAATPLRFDIASGTTIDPTPLLAGVVEQRHRGVDVPSLALGFHEAVADIVGRVATEVAAETGIELVGLTGGVFQNALLSTLCRARLEREGLRALEHRLVPANDGGLALGQALVAGRQVAREGRG